jgi:NADH-quinone oxidoreductase subunit A
MTSELSEYVPAGFYAVLALGFVAAACLAPEILARRLAAPGKATSYECGMPPVGDARIRPGVHFYRVAVLFLLFDIEAAFLFPWAAVAPKAGAAAAVSVSLFLLLAGVGLLVAWRKGILEWEP